MVRLANLGGNLVIVPNVPFGLWFTGLLRVFLDALLKNYWNVGFGESPGRSCSRIFRYLRVSYGLHTLQSVSVVVFDPILSNLFNIQEILGVPSKILLYLPNNKPSQYH
jgi:hypothetical protein